jgi:glycosyltransferase involved in cell wall biosynthesis
MALNKKIILTVSNDLTYDQRMQRICRSLAGAGYEVELVGRERDSSAPLANEPFKQTRLKCWFNKGKLFYIEYNLRLISYLRSQEFDAACAIDLDTIAAVYMAGNKTTKLIYDAHEYFTEVPEVLRRNSVRKVWQWVEETFVPRFDLAYTVSPKLAELFSIKYRKPFHVIMNAPVLSNSSVTRHPTPVTLLYQGALNEGRALEHLIEAMQGINAKLLLAGQGDLSNELRALAKRLNIETKVQFLGYLKPDELRKITAQATIGINVLENKGLSYYYSLSNKFFDYIHALVPQICIDFPEYRKINDEYNRSINQLKEL